MKIIALDPGEDTGWARGTLEDGKLTVDSYGFTKWKQFALHFLERVAEYDVVVYESWRLRKSSALELIGSDMQSSQCIGCIKLAVWTAPKIIKLVHQEPAIKDVIDSMKGGKDYLPKAIDGKEHHRDAIRHLWYYAVTKEGVKP